MVRDTSHLVCIHHIVLTSSTHSTASLHVLTSIVSGASALQGLGSKVGRFPRTCLPYREGQSLCIATSREYDLSVDWASVAMVSASCPASSRFTPNSLSAPTKPFGIRDRAQRRCPARLQPAAVTSAGQVRGCLSPPPVLVVRGGGWGSLHL